MAFSERNLDDYVDVAERIQEFYDRYPEGSLQPADPAHPWEQAVLTGRDKNGEEAAQTFIVYTAAAYRTPDDTRPGIGIAWEIWPGRTPYTRGSEVMNAETSAWGRAIAALGIATKKGIASRQEVANRRHEREDGLPTNADGSLSRSRTTDTEKDAAGVMTSAQQAEHTALGGGHPGERKTEPGVRAKVTHIRANPGCTLAEPCHQPDCLACYPSDEWTKPLPAEALPAEQRPGSIGPAQLRHIHEAFTKAGISDRANRLGITATIVGREVESSKDLSYAEAQKLLAGLAERTKGAK